MSVFAPGSNVLIDDSVKAIVISILVSADNYVQYKCGWWTSGNEYRTEWFEAKQVVSKPESLTRIGFNNDR